MKQSVFSKIFCLAAVPLLFSCGVGNESNPELSPKAKGAVSVLLTDGPVDASRFIAANASVNSVKLMGEDDEEVVLYSDQNETYDLLQLKHTSIPFSFNDAVPEGRYCKIRLTLDQFELVEADDTPEDISDNIRHYPKLPGNGKLDLVIRGCVDVVESEMITLQMDFDVGKSIHIKETGNGYNIRPVIFVDVLDEKTRGKLVRLEGEISEVDAQENALLVCDAVKIPHSDAKACVQVRLEEYSAYFDSVNYAGDARPLSELLVEEQVGQRISLAGWVTRKYVPRHSVIVPKGHLPSPGNCRVWEIGVPPGRQASAMNCEDVPQDLPQETLLVTHEGVQRDVQAPYLFMQGLAIMYGEFQSLEGTVSNEPGLSQFVLSVDTEEPQLLQTVSIQANEETYNGTRIVSRSGDLLSGDETLQDKELQVFGVKTQMGDGEEFFKSALIIVDQLNP